MEGNMPLAGRTALITGAGRNSGAAIARAFAAEGANIVVNVRSSIAEGEAVVEAVRALGRTCILSVADVTDSRQVAAMAEEAAQLGPIDILVNSVGIAPMAPLEDTTDERWDQVLKTSLFSVFYCTRQFIEPMKARRWGRVINIGGVAGIRGSKYKSANAAAKAGVIGFTRAISNEFSEFGITCNHVAPGHMENTPKPVDWDQQPAMDPDYYDRWIREHVPVGRRGRADEIADMCVYLASEKGAYITGQTIPINGGMVFV
jgi:NAD(P)-dependent dehydrogenase (short-subunit alcohol dehydrogenase family)